MTNQTAAWGAIETIAGCAGCRGDLEGGELDQPAFGERATVDCHRPRRSRERLTDEESEEGKHGLAAANRLPAHLPAKVRVVLPCAL
jgi:hypothetical protein